MTASAAPAKPRPRALAVADPAAPRYGRLSTSMADRLAA
jgi:hypothetical protein